MKTLLILSLCAGPCLANSYYEQQGNNAAIRSAIEDQTWDMQHATDRQTNAIKQAAEAQTAAMKDAVLSASLDSYSYSSPRISMTQLKQFADMVREDQKQKDNAELSLVTDEKNQPLYLSSTDGKYSIGPLYVKPGVKWEALAASK